MTNNYENHVSSICLVSIFALAFYKCHFVSICICFLRISFIVFVNNKWSQFLCYPGGSILIYIFGATCIATVIIKVHVLVPQVFFRAWIFFLQISMFFVCCCGCLWQLALQYFIFWRITEVTHLFSPVANTSFGPTMDAAGPRTAVCGPTVAVVGLRILAWWTWTLKKVHRHIHTLCPGAQTHTHSMSRCTDTYTLCVQVCVCTWRYELPRTVQG